jgi:hypothetical protein
MIDGLQHVEGDNKCNICQTDFTDDEGGMLGYIGILPIAFCPFCYSGICDMMDQLDDREWEDLTEREMMDAIYIDDSPMEMGRKIEAKLKEKNSYE